MAAAVPVMSMPALAHAAGAISAHYVRTKLALIIIYMRADYMLDAAGQSSAATAVSKAWQYRVHCHLVASLAAAVPVPPMPVLAPAAAPSLPRHVLAYIFPVQGPHGAD